LLNVSKVKSRYIRPLLRLLPEDRLSEKNGGQLNCRQMGEAAFSSYLCLSSFDYKSVGTMR
jgi:hypothetical protein